MLRKFITAAALAASVVAIAPSAALAQDRGHGGRQIERSYERDHGARQVYRGGRGSHGYDRGYGYQNDRRHGYPSNNYYVRDGRGQGHGRGYGNTYRGH